MPLERDRVENAEVEDDVRVAKTRRENETFWARMGGRPDFQGARVLEVGSGWGVLSIDLALAGARSVVGLDLKQTRIDYARGLLARESSDVAARVEFRCEHLGRYVGENFDCIVSKDTFEHIVDLDVMLAEMKDRLVPGGRIYSGFGPLYTSPYGDHDRRRMLLKSRGALGRFLAAIPWGHLFLEGALIRAHNRTNPNRPATSMRDLGLNGLAPRHYRRVFARSKLEWVSCRVNQTQSPLGRALGFLGRVPLIREYCTQSLYCVFEKPKG